MNTIQNIERILNLQLEEERFGDDYDSNQKNTYSDGLTRIRFDDIVIDDFSPLLPYLKHTHTLTLCNVTIPNISSLSKLGLDSIKFDGVVFQNNDCDKKVGLFTTLVFSNMTFDASVLRCLKEKETNKNKKGWEKYEFINCHIDNIQYLSEIQPLFLLILDNTTSTHKPIKSSKNSVGRIDIYNSTLKDISFLPFQHTLRGLIFKKCKIDDITGITKFPKLDYLSIDSDTVVRKKSSVETNKKIHCNLMKGEKPITLKMLRSLSNIIESINFEYLEEKEIKFIEEFKALKKLSFNRSKVYLNAFSPIAGQIKSIYFNYSQIKQEKGLKYFKNVTGFYFRELDSFEPLLPLKNKLKRLEIRGDHKTKAPELLKEFKELRSLKLSFDVSAKGAKSILKLEKLKKLSLNISDENKDVLDLQKLKNLEYLMLETDVNLIGFEHLQKLKSLQIGKDYSSTPIDINKIPEIKSLQRLKCPNYYSHEVTGLSQFPNLKYLGIKNCSSIKLGKLDKLKVLDLEGSSIKHFPSFETLPNLKKLGLPNAYGNVNLKGVDKCPNLEYLTVIETGVEDISVLEFLKKLKYLDLYETNISDVSVVNKLPNLKKVNLLTHHKHKFEDQLDNPKVAVYCGVPYIYLSVWEKDKYGI